MATKAPPPLPRRRAGIGFNVLVQIAAVSALVLMSNWMASRYHRRYEWASTLYYDLAPKTRQVLAALKEPLDIVVFIPSGSEQSSDQKVLRDTRDLLKEFQYAGKGMVRVEYVDPQHDLNRARQLVEKYHLNSPDQIIFALGDRHKLVRLDDTFELDQSMYGEGARIKAFKGEGVFLSAIQAVTEEKPSKVYFLTGHGERDIADPSERDGYTGVSAYIKRDNITAEKWNLLEKQALPADASAVVIAGPRTAYTDVERNMLEDYLKNQGRLFVMLDPRQKSGLEPFLKNWGVLADDNLICSRLLAMINVTALGSDYSRHPITAKLVDINTTFPYARSVRPVVQSQAPAADQPQVTELVRTPEDFWGESNPNNERIQFDPNTDIPGPLPLAVAVERGKPRDENVNLGVTRMVVVGCSSFAANGNLSGGNVDFFMNSLNWLMKREQQIAVGPKTAQEFGLDMSVKQVLSVCVLAVVGMPLLVGLVGFTVWLRRRR